MGALLETLKARLTGALDGGIDGITLSAVTVYQTLSNRMEDHPMFVFRLESSSREESRENISSKDRIVRWTMSLRPLAGITWVLGWIENMN